MSDFSIFNSDFINSRLIQYFMNEILLPKSTAQNPLSWKLWHWFNNFLGGVAFMIGSFVLFPFLSSYFDNDEVCAWLYTIGSIAYLLADITEWLHWTNSKCTHLANSLSCLISFVASSFYLVGSVCFIPEIALYEEGWWFFDIGSAIVLFLQSWNMFRTLRQQNKSMMECIKQDQSAFIMDVLAGFGGLMYILGTFIIVDDYQDDSELIPAYTLYTIGGILYFASGCFMQKRYFFDRSFEKGYTATSSQLASGDI